MVNTAVQCINFFLCIKVNVPMAGHLRRLYQWRDIHTKSYFHLSLAHGLSRNRDVSHHWYVYLNVEKFAISIWRFSPHCVVKFTIHSNLHLSRVSAVAYAKSRLSFNVSECKQSEPYELLSTVRLQRLPLSPQAPHPRTPSTEPLYGGLLYGGSSVVYSTNYKTVWKSIVW